MEITAERETLLAEYDKSETLEGGGRVVSIVDDDEVLSNHDSQTPREEKGRSPLVGGFTKQGGPFVRVGI